MIRTTSLLLGGLMFTAWPAEAANRHRPSTQQPNVIYVFPDQYRNAALGFWAQDGFRQVVNFRPDPVHTPRLNAFARESLVLTSAQSNCPLSSPHRGSLLTGMYPNKSGVPLNCNSTRPISSLRTDVVGLGDLFSRAGYECAYIGKLHTDFPTPNDPEHPGQYVETQRPVWDAYTPLERRHGFNYWYSYGTFDEHKRPHYWDTQGKKHEIRKWSPEHEADQVIGYLKNKAGQRDGGKPFFLMLSMNPPHSPYRSLDDCMEQDYALYRDRTPEQLLIRPNADLTRAKVRSAAYYFASVTGVDREFGRILDELHRQGLDKNTIVVFTSDHGETMCSQGTDDPKNSPYTESMNVPFLIRYPQKIRPRVDNLLLSSPDIMPTLAGLCGLQKEIPSTVQGVNYAPLFLGKETVKRPYGALYLQNVDGEKDINGLVTSYFPMTRGIKTERYTLALTIDKKSRTLTKTLLFDDQKDPYQLKNLSPEEHPDVMRELLKAMAQELKRIEDPWYKEGILSNLIPYENEALVKHERLLSFESEQVPDYIHGKITLSTAHFKDGSQSLRWDFKAGETLSFRLPLHYEPKDATGKDLYLSTFVTWLYSEQSMEGEVTFQFLKQGKVCCSFPMKINFSGWRGAWVVYERDMLGQPVEGMDELRIVAPEHKGTLFFDHLIPAVKTDPRQQTADIHLPFVNKETTSHWLVIYKHSLLKPDIALTPFTEQEKEDIRTLEQRFRQQIYTPGKLTSQQLDQMRKAYRFYDIRYDENGQVSGRPIFFTRQSECYERLIIPWEKNVFDKNGVEMKDYFDLMNRMAVAFHNATVPADRDELKRMFLAMYDHITDQGVSYGSCFGNIHHYGYSFRGFYTAYFLMKEVLQEAGKLQAAERAMLWYAITNEVYEKPTLNGIDMDAFNTMTQGRIASILMMLDSPEKVQYLRSFSRWLDVGCYPAPGLRGSFKSDGAAFHHCNNYPAYAVGGLEGATAMIQLLSRTTFAVTPLAHETVKKVLFAMRFYCNKEHYPLSMSGRHPDGLGKLTPIHYARMALAGTPDGKQELDRDMAAAYLRLISDETQSSVNPEYMPSGNRKKELELKQILIERGCQAEPDPQGNLALGYGCVSVQRRSNWSAVVRGHSRYLWAAEHYLGADLYGRYLAHGSMEVMTAPAGQTVTPLSGGWQEAGFDWGRIPGTTAIHLPVEMLQANILNVDTYSGMEEMLYSDEYFAGGLSQEGMNGNFGMKLHEHDKYNGSHRARKSFHFLEDEIVCLGSDIENTNADYPTETTLFQLVAVNEQQRMYWMNPLKGDNYWMDGFGTGYYFPRQQIAKMHFERNFPQHSRNEETTKPTQGDWVTLTVNHGNAPQNEGYEYAVVPQVKVDRLKSLAAKPNYQVLQRDKMAHILRAGNRISYVLFGTPQYLPQEGVLIHADTACLVMTKEQRGKVLLTVCNPDLALYRGTSDEVFTVDGKRVERSIYSRPWKENECLPVPVTLTLRGKWNVRETESVKILSCSLAQTVLRVNCREGKSYDIECNK